MGVLKKRMPLEINAQGNLVAWALFWLCDGSVTLTCEYQAVPLDLAEART
jgi:hypothetical protein